MPEESREDEEPSARELTSREERLSRAFVELSDTLVGSFDVIEFLHLLTEHCVDLLGVPAAGVLLATPAGRVLDVAASDARTRRLVWELVGWQEGPCHDCYHLGTPVLDTDLTDPRIVLRWPRLVPHAAQLGFTRTAAVPLRLREEVIGALGLFHTGPAPLDWPVLRLGQALADVATIGILSQRAARDRHTVIAQVHGTVHSRTMIEQAVGILTARRAITPDEAFTLLRGYARDRGRLLTEVAREVIDGHADAALLTAPATDPGTGSEFSIQNVGVVEGHGIKTADPSEDGSGPDVTDLL